MASNVFEYGLNCILPGVLIGISIAYHVATAITAPKLLLSNFKSYRSLVFSKFFNAIGKQLAEDTPPQIETILATSRGVILDIGPGPGHQVHRFSHPENITVIYGAEPGVDMHGALQEKAKQAGLGGKYKILACGAEPDSLIPALAKEGLLGKTNSLGDGIFDEIVSIRVLCGVPKPEETVQGLYKCLKPGGRFVFCEHVVNDPHRDGNWVARSFQQLYMSIGWSFLLGECSLTRDTAATIMKAAQADGGWAEMSLSTDKPWGVIPTIVGYCVKKN